MQDEPNSRHRRLMRWRGYDYRQVGCYFVTLCVANREAVLSTIHDNHSTPTDVGLIIEDELLGVAERFAGVGIDIYILMPDHLHAIVTIDHHPAGLESRPSLSDIMRAFKSRSVILTNRFLQRGRAPFWQRNYYDRVLRDERETLLARHYILDNPARSTQRREQL